MTYKLFIDADGLNPPDNRSKFVKFLAGIKLAPKYAEDWIKVYNYDDAVNYMHDNGCPYHVSFSNSLGDWSRGDGADIAKVIIHRDSDWNKQWIPKDFSYAVHSDVHPTMPETIGKIDEIMSNYLKSRK